MPNSSAARDQRRSKYGIAYYIAKDPSQLPMLRLFARSYIGMVQRADTEHYQKRGRFLDSYWQGDDGFWRAAAYMAMELGDRPDGPEWSIDRIDNDDGYGPGNIRWATRQTQGRNRSASSRLPSRPKPKPFDMQPPSPLLVRSEMAASMAGVSIKTLDAWRSKGVGPPFIRLTSTGRGVRYRLDGLKKWIEEQGAP